MSAGSPAARFKLGAFELIEVIGRGGSGEVWRGRHVGSDLPVAVKVLHGDRARKLEVRARFREEVRAVARLDHPGIVVVYDHGEIPRSVQAESEGRMVARSPYFVMEYSAHGSLEDKLPSNWRETRGVLLACLHALAHAHARGVIHRDVKPGNVLLGSPGFGKLLLTDFGIAHAITRASDTKGRDHLTGTPQYMAPEQCLGRWRDFGPGTDLYALGTMAWELTTKRVPFHNLEGSALLQAQVGRELPAFKPRMAVPDGLEGWLERMLEKERLLRPECAADAAWALINLGDAEEDAEGKFGDGLSSMRSQAEFQTWSSDMQGDTFTYSMSPEGPSGTFAGLGTFSDDHDPSLYSTAERASILPPMPESWRRMVSNRVPARLLGAGLGLYGLRTVPFVGREDERDALWQSLALVRRSLAPRVVLLRGGAGHGKSRLAEWLGDRAAEMGSATKLRTVHGDMPGPAHGLAPTIASFFRAGDLAFKQVSSRAKQWLRSNGVDEAWQWDDVARLVAPKYDLEGAFFRSPRERTAAIRRLFEIMTRQRPLLLWLDDAQWGAQSLAFVIELLKSGHSLPVLVVCSVRDDLLADRPVETQMLRWLEPRADVQSMQIGAMSKDDHQQLVGALLGLEGKLVNRVVERTAGNPLFAVQLIGDWVQRGLLVPGDKGFVLAEGSDAALPDDIHALWSSRVRTAVFEAGGGEPELISLEIAATLGLEVDMAEWRTTCAAAGIKPNEDLLIQLEKRDLTIMRPGGWSFAHGMLRESVERSAREAERWKSHNEAAAKMVATRYGHMAPQARIAQHLLEADAKTAAIGPLLEGARQYFRVSRYKEAKAFLVERERVVDSLKIDEHDRRRSTGWALLSRLHLALSEYEEASALAKRLRDSSYRRDRPRLRGEALFVLGEASRRRGKNDEATRDLWEAKRLFADAGDADNEGLCLRSLVELHRSSGDLATASMLGKKALQLADEQKNVRATASTLQLLGSVCVQQGDIDTAEKCFQRAMHLQERSGLRRGLMNSVNGLAEIARKRGDLALAEKGYLKAIAEAERIGASEAAVLPLNRAMVLIERGEHHAARHVLTKTIKRLERIGRQPLVAIGRGIALVPAAALGDFVEFAEHFDVMQPILASSGFAEADLATCLVWAGDLASLKGEVDNAKRAYVVAIDQWERLRHDSQAESVRERLTRLSV